MLLEPMEQEIDGKTYILSKFPAVAGREIMMNYPISAIPKIGDYKTNEDMMRKIMHYVAVSGSDGNHTPLQLTTAALIDNHVKDWETLAKIEIAMMEYNCSFFRDGRASSFFESIAQKLPEWTLKILTAFSEQSSQKEKQPFMN